MYDPLAAPPGAAPVYDDGDWAVTLQENVKDGLVDYEHLSQSPEALRRYLEMIAWVGPNSAPDLFPASVARQAYYMNAYNACVLSVVLKHYPRATIHDLALPPLEAGYDFRIDGGIANLARIRDSLLRESAGDPRVLFGLCNAGMGSPPLQDIAFQPDILERQLQYISRTAIDNANLVRIDHLDAKLQVWIGFIEHRDMFYAYLQRVQGTGYPTLLSVLMTFASDTRREWLTSATGYKTAIIKFDRALNAWRPRPQ